MPKRKATAEPSTGSPHKRAHVDTLPIHADPGAHPDATVTLLRVASDAPPPTRTSAYGYTKLARCARQLLRCAWADYRDHQLRLATEAGVPQDYEHPDEGARQALRTALLAPVDNPRHRIQLSNALSVLPLPQLRAQVNQSPLVPETAQQVLTRLYLDDLARRLAAEAERQVALFHAHTALHFWRHYHQASLADLQLLPGHTKDESQALHRDAPRAYRFVARRPHDEPRFVVLPVYALFQSCPALVHHIPLTCWLEDGMQRAERIYQALQGHLPAPLCDIVVRCTVEL